MGRLRFSSSPPVGQKASGFAARPEEQQPDAGGGEPCDRSDLMVRIALCVCKPEKLALAWPKLQKRRAENGSRVGLARAIGRLERFLRHVFDSGVTRPAPVVAEQVGRDAKQVPSGRYFAVDLRGARSGREKADAALLQQVVGKRRVAGSAREIGPQRTCRALVEPREGVIVHVGGETRPTGENRLAGDGLRNGRFERHGPLLSHGTRTWASAFRNRRSSQRSPDP